MKKKAFTKRELNPLEYVNTVTGETMASELKNNRNNKVIASEESDYIIMDYDEYLVIETKNLNKINKILSRSDSSRFIEMANWLKTMYNIVYNNNVPHTLETLSGALDLSKDETTKLVNRLVKKGLMAYVVCAPSGHIQKLYMMNPSVVRKRRKFDKELMTFFKDINLEK